MKKNPPPYLGCHVSVAGGVALSPERAQALKCNVMQIFTRNQRQWKAIPVTDTECEEFLDAAKKHSIDLSRSCSHASYLMNIGNPGLKVRQPSLHMLREEIERCERLGIAFVNFHPGSHLGEGEEPCMKRIAKGMNVVLAETEGYKVKMLLETTAGQGTNMGYRFEHLRDIIDQIKEPDRVGVCVDTCHIFAAGYDLRTPETYRKSMNKLKKIIGKRKILAFHLNDSKCPFDSRKDRHEHIGKGEIGLEGFRCLMNDPDWKKTPFYLETPEGEGKYAVNLKVLRKLIK